MDVDFNPFDPAFRANPYPVYEQLRREAPLLRSPLGIWIVTRYRDCQTLLREKRVAASDPTDPKWRPNGEPVGLMLKVMSRWMLFKNPPDHTRIRSLVSKAFTTRSVSAMRPSIQDLVDQQVGRCRELGRFDLVAELAYPLPTLVIAAMLGVPAEDRDLFRDWMRDLAPIIDPIITPDKLERAERAVEKFLEYFRDLVAERRKDPRADLLSATTLAEEAGDHLSEDELLANAVLLFGAGHETTMNLIGNGVLALLRHPAELERLRAEPARVPNAIEEFLRYDSPVQMTGRVAVAPFELAGQTIQPKEEAIAIVGSANRDADVFPDPDRLDIGRPEPEHLSFGHGVHYCLGANLARLEAEIAILAIVRRLPRLELDEGEIEWRETITLRGVKSLPLRTS